ncbi:uncharacterized protein CELE_B0228.8 [Caenorhabditis elegans]|uniref:Uncharacterized protein B0228.8 n=1 Tax=Caenorhabditis elegans TaxID=6239 RepID=YP78_CAEEL|nr:Uncharacterized protein CELE_B0228.8 [Caenorhabditis elegans]Q09224.2 RecName: Full=Uncharacterized protein B0228.8; Flags: Precursor [Caenorhabditis elegans]CCD61452.1 Uncharacterized protein CELE_B0228.8 [Caenorhabditis elegans]|eukprot:NP_495630.2 Uncharacterized protein CELE_B0228.8 [Caenorhabditis elegans]
MRRFTLFVFFLSISIAYADFDFEDYNFATFNEIYDNEIPDDIPSSRHFLKSSRGTVGLPKTATEMMTRFNENLLNFLKSKSENDWKLIMELMSPDAFIETCMESAYGLSMDQFHKWITFLSNYYAEVGLTSTKIKDNSETGVTTELVYYTVLRNGEKGSDKWAMSATLNKKKGHFCINTLHMLSECKNIPKKPSLEPAIPIETFISSLKKKLVNDIFLNGGLHYKSAYESMYNYITPATKVFICDVGKMNGNQFVEYWYKRFGKVQTYSEHVFDISNNGTNWHVDFEVTYESEPGKFYRDRYQFSMNKYTNVKVEYFENFLDWRIYQIQQNCTESRTKMSKSDASVVKMALASRRWDQMLNKGLSWDTLQAFKEMFDKSKFHGYTCGMKFENWAKFDNWLTGFSNFYAKSVPKQTNVYAYQDSKIGFWIVNTMSAASDNSTSTHRVFFEGYYVC